MAEGRQQLAEGRQHEVEEKTQLMGGRVKLKDIRDWLSQRQLEKLSRMQERLHGGREGLKAQSHTQHSLEKQKSIRRRWTQRRRNMQIIGGGHGMGRRLKPTYLQLLLSSSQLQRAHQEEERLQRETRQGRQKAALWFCSIRGQKVMREQEGRCISSGAACRSEGLIYQDEVGYQRDKQKKLTDAKHLEVAPHYETKLSH